jgi:hypothetical protein
MSNFDDMKLAVEALTGGKNTVVLDDIGMPSIIVVLPTMYSDALITGATQAAHPGFVLDNVVKEKVGISKFHNIIMNSRAYSLPMQDPKANITWQQAQDACRAKGEGWGLTPFSLWGAIALWCKKNGTMPHGNNNYGKDITYPYETGVASYTYTESNVTKIGRTATGSGPATWYHDHTPAGIADLNGNVWDWCAGMRLVKGEIQIIPYANCMSATCDMGVNSTEWKAIKADGTLVEPGTDGTLKYDIVSSKVTLCTSITSQADSGRGATFETMALASGVTAPQILKELALFPADSSGYEGDYFYVNNGADERFPGRGGGWDSGASAGVFYTSLYDPRSHSNHRIGFRSAFYGEL